MPLKDRLTQLLERGNAEEGGSKKGFLTILLVLVLMIGWTVYAQFFLPRYERKAEARAISYPTGLQQDITPPPEREEKPVMPKPQAEKPKPEATKTKPPRQQRQQTEAERLRIQARNHSHYAGPFGEAWRQLAGNGSGAEESAPPPPYEGGRQTLEVPPARNAVAKAGNQSGPREATSSEIAGGDVWRKDFYERGKGQTGVLQPPQSPFMVMRGTVIPVKLLNQIDTQTPGQITAVVTQDIRDTATGKYVMIPKDSVVVGGYDTELVPGQNKLPTAWDQLNFPNGETMNLASIPGADRHGAAGMEVNVNNHYLRRFGQAALLTLSGAAARAASYGGYGNGFDEAVRQQGSQELNRTTRQGWAGNRYRGPTGTAKAGEVFLLQVSENLGPFPGDYYERASGGSYALSE